jgi:hypothetical protein
VSLPRRVARTEGWGVACVIWETSGLVIVCFADHL